MIPKKNRINIVKDNPEVSLVCHVLYTCGKKDMVVSNAANKPIISKKAFIIILTSDFKKRRNSIFKNIKFLTF